MEVKGILDKIRQQDKEKGEYFFALQVEQGLVKAAIWTTEVGKVKILAVGEPQGWVSEEEFLGAIDLAISSAGERLPAPEAGVETTEGIFWVVSGWVGGG